jgi:hypothetical protein
MKFINFILLLSTLSTTVLANSDKQFYRINYACQIMGSDAKFTDSYQSKLSKEKLSKKIQDCIDENKMTAENLSDLVDSVSAQNRSWSQKVRDFFSGREEQNKELLSTIKQQHLISTVINELYDVINSLSKIKIANKYKKYPAIIDVFNKHKDSVFKTLYNYEDHLKIFKIADNIDIEILFSKTCDILNMIQNPESIITMFNLHKDIIVDEYKKYRIKQDNHNKYTKIVEKFNKDLNDTLSQLRTKFGNNIVIAADELKNISILLLTEKHFKSMITASDAISLKYENYLSDWKEFTKEIDNKTINLGSTLEPISKGEKSEQFFSIRDSIMTENSMLIMNQVPGNEVGYYITEYYSTNEFLAELIAKIE